MKLLADKTGEQFVTILKSDGDVIVAQFISNEGKLEGHPFKASLSKLLLVGWTLRKTSTAIGLHRFKQGYLEDEHVSFALHQLFPLGRKVRLPSGDVVKIASYANTNPDGYYMYVQKLGAEDLTRLKILPSWELLPSEQFLRLPYYPAPKTQLELDAISDFEQWSGGY